MPNRIAPALVAVLWLTACTTTSSIPHAERYAKRVSRLTLIDEGCPNRTCPNFEITFQRSGIATYHGHKNVDRIGRFSGRLEAEDWINLAAWAGKHRLYKEDQHYLGVKRNLGKKILKVYRGKKVTRILFGNGAEVPEKITKLAEDMVEAAEDIEWGD